MDVITRPPPPIFMDREPGPPVGRAQPQDVRAHGSAHMEEKKPAESCPRDVEPAGYSVALAAMRAWITPVYFLKLAFARKPCDRYERATLSPR